MHPLSPGEPFKHFLKDLRVPPPHVNEQSPHSPNSLQVGQSDRKLQTCIKLLTFKKVLQIRLSF